MPLNGVRDPVLSVKFTSKDGLMIESSKKQKTLDSMEVRGPENTQEKMSVLLKLCYNYLPSMRIML